MARWVKTELGRIFRFILRVFHPEYMLRPASHAFETLERAKGIAMPRPALRVRGQCAGAHGENTYCTKCGGWGGADGLNRGAHEPAGRQRLKRGERSRECGHEASALLALMAAGVMPAAEKVRKPGVRARSIGRRAELGPWWTAT